MTKPIPAPVKNPNLDVVCFDLDDTLWAVDPVIEAANAAMFAELGRLVPGFSKHFSAEQWPALRAEVCALHPTLVHSVTALRRQVISLMLERLGHQGEQAQAWLEQAFACFRQARNQVTLFADAEPMLQCLQKLGYRLGVFSNGNANLDAIGIAHYFDWVLNADQVGAAKPDAAAFAAIEQAAGCAAERILYVGDSYQHDVVGAAAAGMRSFWLNPQQLPCPARCQPDYQSQELAQLPSLISY